MDAAESLLPRSVGASVTKPAHSGIGIASLVISIVAGIGMLLVVLVAGVMQLRMPGGLREHKIVAMMLGVVMFGLFVASLSGVGLAIGGLCQKERRKIFAILGLVLNAAILLGTIGLIIFGKMHHR